jgi:hypothetical protein
MKLSELSKETGIPSRTLRHAAKTGKLKAQREDTLLGPVYRSTLRAVAEWQADPTAHRTPKKPT